METSQYLYINESPFNLKNILSFLIKKPYSVVNYDIGRSNERILTLVVRSSETITLTVGLLTLPVLNVHYSFTLHNRNSKTLNNLEYRLAC